MSFSKKIYDGLWESPRRRTFTPWYHPIKPFRLPTPSVDRQKVYEEWRARIQKAIEDLNMRDASLPHGPNGAGILDHSYDFAAIDGCGCCSKHNIVGSGMHQNGYVADKLEVKVVPMAGNSLSFSRTVAKKRPHPDDVLATKDTVSYGTDPVHMETAQNLYQIRFRPKLKRSTVPQHCIFYKYGMGPDEALSRIYDFEPTSSTWMERLTSGTGDRGWKWPHEPKKRGVNFSAYASPGW